MKIPSFFIGTVLIFWGIETEKIVIGLILALLVEGAQFVKEKWTLQEDDFIRISDLTSVIFLASIGLILLNNDEPTRFFRITTIWLPATLLPLIIAQLYSANEKIIIGTQIGAKKKKSFKHDPLDFKLYYTITCICSSAAANSRSMIFYPGIIILLSWILFYNRGKYFSNWFFINILIITTTIGYFGFLGIEQTHQYVKEKSRFLWRGYISERHADPYKAYLSYGSLGRLKLSGKILLRVNSDSPPPLLHEVSYNIFNENSWHINRLQFETTPRVGGGIWELLPQPHPDAETISIEQNLPKDKGIVVRPYGTYQLISPLIFKLKNNKEGTLKAIDCAPIINSSFLYNPLSSKPNDTPDDRNLQIPEEEKRALKTISEKLFKDSLAPAIKLRSLRHFFSNDFSYTLSLQNKGKHKTVLSNFLLANRTGHCELFASATALLLRSAGIPSRYVTGFVVEEFSPIEKRYIVRARHAHAWSEAYIDNKWIVVDTTPPDWQTYDQSKASFFEPLRDIVSFLRQKYKLFQIESEQNYNTLLSFVIVGLTLILVYRIYRRLQMKKESETNTSVLQRMFKSHYSPFNDLEKILEQVGVERKSHEPFLHWLKTIKSKRDLPFEEIASLYNLHQKFRFDQSHFSGSDMKKLQSEVLRLTPIILNATYLKNSEKNQD